MSDLATQLADALTEHDIPETNVLGEVDTDIAPIGRGLGYRMVISTHSMLRGRDLIMLMHPDESALYAHLRHASVPTERWCGASTVLAIAARIGMRTVRLDELLAGRSRAGWWEDGGSFSGHFTDRAPRSIGEIEQVAA